MASLKLTTTVAVAGAAIAASISIWFRHWHDALGSKVSHRNVSDEERRRAHEGGAYAEVPSDVMKSAASYHVVHERDEHPVRPWEHVNDGNAAELFTSLLRRDMRLFARFPQSWMLWIIAASGEQRRSFSQSHIHRLDFVEGDLFCGFYRVVHRAPTKVEIKLERPAKLPPMEGMLILELLQHGGGALLRTETLQWCEKSNGNILPLDKPALRFMHEMASWWLLVSGAEYITTLRSKNQHS